MVRGSTARLRGGGLGAGRGEAAGAASRVGPSPTAVALADFDSKASPCAGGAVEDSPDLMIASAGLRQS
eukprot:5267135-Pyramimonas_sp.AAC.1